jgi:general secretion pathway protein D
LDRLLPVPELKPLGPARYDLKINSNIPKTLFETLCGVAGINLLWDSDMQPANTAPIKTSSVTFQDSTLDEALDYLAVLTHFFWKPMSSNTIFVTNDTKPKRNDYADQVLKVFYISNLQQQNDLTELVNAIRTTTQLQYLLPVVSQNAIVARGDADTMALVEKIIHDLDRPKPEVMIDVIVMQTSTNYSRQLAAALLPTGLNMAGTFAPGGISSSSSSSSSSGTTTTGTTTTGTTTGSTTSSLPISSLGHLSSADWSTTLPSGLLEAVMSNTETKILQAPEVRAVDNAKASMKIGDREPFASGSFGSALGLSGAGVSPLVNTQFQYQDIGVNMDILPRIHDNGDVSLHIEMEISSIDGYVNLGGVSEPIVAQKKVVNDQRLHGGEVSLLGGLIDEETDTTKNGVPGIEDIPILGRLFRSDSITKTRSELMIAIVPHVLRGQVFSEENLRAIDVGSQNTIHVSYAPKPGDGVAATPGETTGQATTVLTPAPLPATAQPTAPTPATSPVPQQQPGTVPGAPGPPGAPGAIPFPLQQLLRPQGGPPIGLPGIQPGTSIAPPGTQPQQPPAPTPPGTQPQQPAQTAPAPPSGAAQSAGAPAASAATRFEPANLRIAANGAFAASLVVDSGADLVSAQPLQIKYDPKMLKLLDVSAGDLFSKDGSAALFSKDVQEAQGIATVQTSRQPGASGVNGPGTLLTLRFQALAPGATTVSVLNVTLRNSQARTAGSSQPELAVSIN